MICKYQLLHAPIVCEYQLLPAPQDVCGGGGRGGDGCAAACIWSPHQLCARVNGPRLWIPRGVGHGHHAHGRHGVPSVPPARPHRTRLLLQASCPSRDHLVMVTPATLSRSYHVIKSSLVMSRQFWELCQSCNGHKSCDCDISVISHITCVTVIPDVWVPP